MNIHQTEGAVRVAVGAAEAGELELFQLLMGKGIDKTEVKKRVNSSLQRYINLIQPESSQQAKEAKDNYQLILAILNT